ncbi:MAG TPA: triphosphoribosyl-dephospho-CoA synthase [Methanoregulaceae archaeon]|nr:MAG: triphosphoribosyl-dephospho-CoA synthase [Methanolinea sp.]HON81292.1 triphosphoribosyl-dephospho-CoA synthase [Methanoregulaceae archaeon]HPD10102.1 triphosphoribosyl-dephospho-CoA synthase [Methanoregulaceae archaeon]HRT15108.1 triphosphoribosyl-dephospho-CoA synthase [Methanoregulaceae archaeon]HRU30775.1 triphosphoribosyl-dephospho-CoA synthase [Methanoregulaceae archaeon]
MTHAEQAQLAMMLEVCAFPKPGNVDRCHDYQATRLEHFLASTILVRPALDRAERGEGGIGSLILDAVERTNVHSGGNTHFGAFILLMPLVAGGDIPGADRVVKETTVEDAVLFYKAFGKTKVRVIPGDDLDVTDPHACDTIRQRGMTLFDIMLYSAKNDMVAREWINGFQLTRRGADLLKAHGCGRSSIVQTFLDLLATEPDTFIIKKHGKDAAWKVMQKAQDVRNGLRDLVAFDQECIDAGINPGSIADIMIAALYIALREGWTWDC